MRHRLSLLLCLGAALGACAPSNNNTDAAPADVTAVTDATAESSVNDASPEATVADSATDAAVAPTPVMVTTSAGMLIGNQRGTAVEFLGVPFAAPPLGDNRWRAPQPVAPWTTPRDARARGPYCMQTVSGANPPRVSEDCLQLNVWSAGITGGAGAGRPVMVFVHGGGFTTGSGADLQLDGTLLAASAGAVVVTVNYRLGQFGFLALPELIAEDSAHHSAGNYGLMDQQAALQWVHDNIAAFGGDAGNVTLFGESMGAFSVSDHMVSPQSQGLFHRAITESGSSLLAVTYTTNPAKSTTVNEDAVSLGHRFATALSCSGAGLLACLRGKSAEMVLATTPTGLELTLSHARFQPSIDGYVLPDRPWTLFQTGHFAHVPYMTGTNRDEGTAFAPMFPANSAAEVRAALGTVFPSFTPAQLDQRFTEVQTIYSDTIQGSWSDAWTAMLGDLLFVCPAREQARVVAAAGVPTWLYTFTHENRSGMLLGLGVFHSAELPYIFGNYVSPFIQTPTDAPAAAVMMGVWGRFAQSANPTMADTVAWPAYTMAADQTMQLDTASMVLTGYRNTQCDVVARWLADVH